MASHSDKFLTKVLIGFTLITAAVFVIIFACFERVKYDDWYGWGLGASFLMCIGVYMIASGFVHKMKADLLRRQKAKDLQEKRFKSSSED